jgi:hypothetical protein
MTWMLMLFSSLSLLLSSKASRYTKRLCLVTCKQFLMEKRCKSKEASLVQRSNWKSSGPTTGGHWVSQIWGTPNVQNGCVIYYLKDALYKDIRIASDFGENGERKLTL